MKRNRRTAGDGGSAPDLLTTQLLNHFGFPYHVAPGEAEAECALLQRQGIVDAVLSEDVDTLMFGCGLTLRNWSSEDSRGNHPPTHVSMYSVETTKLSHSRMDREGMVLVALMSGGDYRTEGIPRCGIKVACEAARAGFGKSLCKLSRTDTAGISAWRNDLEHEIRTNENGHFRVKHKNLKIPFNFPDNKLFGYYAHPVVSPVAKIADLKEKLKWDGNLDVVGLRRFVAQAFEWTHRTGAKKFIRGLAPALLVSKLCTQYNRRDSEHRDVISTGFQTTVLQNCVSSTSP